MTSLLVWLGGSEVTLSVPLGVPLTRGIMTYCYLCVRSFRYACCDESMVLNGTQ